MSTHIAIDRLGNFADSPGLPVISKVVVHRGIAYTSGVTGEPGADVATQTQQALERIDQLLSMVHSDRARLLSAQVWLADMADFEAHNAVWDRWVDAANPPARATVKATLTSPDYLVEVTMVAVSGAKKAFTTPGEDGKPGTPNPSLSSAIQVGNRVYVAGITGNTAANKGDVKAQAAESLARIGRTLKAAGYDFNNIVDAVVYLPDLGKFADMNASYVDKLVKDRPARATVGAGLMGADAAVEIMFTAVK